MSTTDHPNGLGAAPRPASAHVESRPRIRTRLVWRRDRLVGLGIAVSLIAMWAAVVGLAILVGQPSEPASQPLPACVTEDSHDCIWDARTQGNGAGQSFVDLDGNVLPVSTRP